MALWSVVIAVLGTAVVVSSELPTVTFSRAYAGKDLGVARKYHAKYFEYVRTRKHVTLSFWTSLSPCANFEANEDGDYMGFFKCQLDFEPGTYKYCCGQKPSHYCCPNASLATPYVTDPRFDKLEDWAIGLIVMAVLIVVLPPIGIGIFCCVAAYCALKPSNNKPAPHRGRNRVVAVTAASGAYPTQASATTGGYPVQQSAGASYPPTQQPAAAYPPPPANTAAPEAYASQSYAQPPPPYSSVVEQK